MDIVFENQQSSEIGFPIAQGVKGDKGDTGAQGIQGSQGSGVKITPWTAGAFLSGDQVNYLGKDWMSNASTVAGDVPGTSSKWVERLSGYSTAFELRGDLFNITGYVDPSAGAFIGDPTYKRTNYIRITRLKDIVVKGENTNVNLALIAFYDKSKVYISCIKNTSATFIETTIAIASIPTNAVYAVASTLATNATVSYVKGISIQDTLQDVENKATTDISTISVKNTTLEKSISGNNFDQVGYINNIGGIETGDYVDYTSRRFTKKIRINKGFDIHIKGENNNGAVNLLSFYDINEIYISGILDDGQPLGTEHIVAKASIPANAVYVVGSTLVSILSTSTIYSDAKIQDNLVAVQQSVAEVGVSINSKRDGNKTVNLYSKKFTSDASGWNLTGWAYDAANKSINSTATGVGNMAELPLIYHIDYRKMTTMVELSAGAIFRIYNHHPTNNNGCSLFSVDLANQKIQVNTGVQYTVYEEGFRAEKSVPAFLVAGRKYIIEIVRDDLRNTITVTDYLSGVSHSVSDANLDRWSGNQNGYYGFYLSAGTAKMYEMNVSSKKNVFILLYGDSITDGAGLTDFSKRYGELLKQDLGAGNLLISSLAGGDLPNLLLKFETEIKHILPNYLMCTIGTNAGNTLARLNTLKANCDAYGIKLILNHTPCEADTNEHIAVNTQIDLIGVDGCKFEYATAIDNNPFGATDGSNSRRNLSLYLVGDGQHPNQDGNIAMYNRFKIDLPYLFN